MGCSPVPIAIGRAGHHVRDVGVVPPETGSPRQRGENQLPLFIYMAYYVYILKSLKDGKYYIGSTSDIAARLAYHNAGKQRSTKNRIPFILVYFETFQNRSEAEMREREIKTFKGGGAFKKLINGV